MNQLLFQYAIRVSINPCVFFQIEIEENQKMIFQQEVSLNRNFHGAIFQKYSNHPLEICPYIHRGKAHLKHEE